MSDAQYLPFPQPRLRVQADYPFDDGGQRPTSVVVEVNDEVTAEMVAHIINSLATLPEHRPLSIHAEVRDPEPVPAADGDQITEGVAR